MSHGARRHSFTPSGYWQQGWTFFKLPEKMIANGSKKEFQNADFILCFEYISFIWQVLTGCLSARCCCIRNGLEELTGRGSSPQPAQSRSMDACDRQSTVTGSTMCSHKKGVLGAKGTLGGEPAPTLGESCGKHDGCRWLHGEPENCSDPCFLNSSKCPLLQSGGWASRELGWAHDA